ncbi:zinc-ribbon domain-containing protein [Desulfobacterales bacterium HSG17]|nr:zinc-ribbon domain-containing protein [Desulfobacterales bacterium HSG17]
MNVTCDNCKTKLTIPDHKIPNDKDSRFKCPKCKEQINIPAVKPEKKIIDLSSGNKLNALALVCVGDNDLQKKVYSTVQDIGLNAQAVETSQEALKKLEYHIYPLVIVDEFFDHNKGSDDIIDKLNVIDMSLRRKICLVLISRQLNTNDDMSALHTSVNSVIHVNDTAHLASFLSKVLTEHKNFYTVYNASLQLTGRA